MTQICTSLCFTPGGRVYQDPVCAEANPALASQKKILNTDTPS